MTLLELLPFALLAVAFWVLLIRPARVRRQEQTALAASLAPGQRVMTTSGIFGTVTRIDGDRLHLEIAPGVEVELVTQAIAQLDTQATAEVAEPAVGTPPADPADASADTDSTPREADRG